MSILKEKFGINCYAEVGIIDLFGLSLSVSELKERVEFDFHDSYGSNTHSFYNRINCEDIDNSVSEIKSIIKQETGEEPHTVRFFAIPNIEYLGFDLCAIAKIDNNGSTFVFSQGERLLEYLNEPVGYWLSVKEV